jgi:hypothetical protein
MHELAGRTRTSSNSYTCHKRPSPHSTSSTTTRGMSYSRSTRLTPTSTRVTRQCLPSFRIRGCAARNSSISS